MGRPRQLIGTPVTVGGDFLAKQGAIATDLSGIAAATPLGARRLDCLVIDNETLWAQRAVFDRDADHLEAGELVPLLPEDRNAIAAIGRPPDDGDFGPDEYILDGEGVAWLAPWYYVTGSHSIHDHTDTGPLRADYRRSAHLVARVDATGRTVELTFRLNRVLESHRALRDHFLKSPNLAKGINIEGIAGYGRRLYFGFRSPVPDSEALILSVRADALFTPRADMAPRLLRAPLGKGIGIRDLAAMPDGRLLVLAGPRNDGAENFSIALFDPNTERAETLGRLPVYPGEKLEGLLLAGCDIDRTGAGTASVVTLSDHPPNGNPRRFELDVPAR